MTTATRVADKKGRITLGADCAGKTFIVKVQGDTFLVEPAVVMPEREAWLYRNKEAYRSVQRGVQQAREGRVAEPPDLEAARKLAKKIKD